jgi:DNA-binding NarL/FixJ family response regulator
MAAEGPVRVVLVDDHPVVRDGLKALLDSVDDMAVVGEAASGEEAIDVVHETSPDVVIMDIEMPGIGGIEATKRLVATNPGSVVLVLTMYGQDEFVFAALRAGARGYLVKGAQQEDVLRTIRAVGRGDAVFGQDVADRLLHSFSTTPAEHRAPFPELTDREREVIALLADGMSNGLIARRLGLTPKTVANHVSNILTKLQAVDRAEVVVRARRAGLGTG